MAVTIVGRKPGAEIPAQLHYLGIAEQGKSPQWNRNLRNMADEGRAVLQVVVIGTGVYALAFRMPGDDDDDNDS